MNEHSSRSHAIFLIFVECSEVKIHIYGVTAHKSLTNMQT